MSVKTYNPKKVTCALGSHNVTGFADDSMITVDYAGDGTSYVEGADGEVVRSIDPSSIYTVKITVQQTSKTNAFLRSQYAKDQTDGNGIFPITIKDILGSEKFSASAAWVTKPASWVRGKTQNNLEWELVATGGSIS